MKKILLLFLTLISLNANAQKIDLDKQEADGSRVLITTQVMFAEHFDAFTIIHRKVLNPLSINLRAKCHVSKEGKRVYAVEIPIIFAKHYIYAKKGSRLLIKLDNDSTMELKTSTKIDELSNEVNVIENVSNYSVILSYDMTPEQVNIFRKHKVEKMRMETDLNYQDIDPSFYDGKYDFSRKFIKCVNVIDKALSKPNNFYNGF